MSNATTALNHLYPGFGDQINQAKPTSAYADAWAKATPETPAGFLLRMAGYEVTLLCRKKVEQDVQYRHTVAQAAIGMVRYEENGQDNLTAIEAAWDALKGSWTQVSKKDATIEVSQEKTP